MTVATFLKQATDELKKAGISSPRLDALVLLEDVLLKDRSWLLAHPETVIQNKNLEKLGRQIARRTRHEPLAYIRCKTEFYGREFFINKHVLEPRPESETMIDLLKELETSLHAAHLSEVGPLTDGENASFHIVDVGTGSGCLAVTAKLEVPDAEVVAIDIDVNCLKVARQNAKNLGAKVEFLQGDLLEPIAHWRTGSSHATILLANLPYVPDNFTINQAAMNEPRHAIFGGPDGLDLYRRLFTQIQQLEQTPHYVLTESLPFQHRSMSRVADKAGYEQFRLTDFIQGYRISRS